MLALARICVLVERRAVEARQREVVLRKVPGHPVENHADAGLMARIDERAEIVGRAEPARGREEPGDLIAPGSLERMFHHRHELDVRETHPRDVRHELGRKLAPRERPKTLDRVAAPRAGVHLVDRHRRVEHGAAFVALGHPLLVLPRV